MRFWDWWTSKAKIESLDLRDKEKMDKYECDKEVEKKNAEAEAQFQEDLSVWRAFSVTSYDPSVFVNEFPNGKFLTTDELVVPLHAIESIKVDSVGSGPKKATYYSYHKYLGNNIYKYVPEFATYRSDKTDAVIIIGMKSGAKHSITVHPKALDVLFDALVTAWKG